MDTLYPKGWYSPVLLAAVGGRCQRSAMAGNHRTYPPSLRVERQGCIPMLLAESQPARPSDQHDTVEGRRRLSEATRDAARWRTPKRRAPKEVAK